MLEPVTWSWDSVWTT